MIGKYWKALATIHTHYQSLVIENGEVVELSHVDSPSSPKDLVQVWIKNKEGKITYIAPEVLKQFFVGVNQNEF